MANGKITEALKNLGLKMNGKEPTGDTTSEVINGIAEDLQGDNIVIEVENITGLTNEQCEALKCGDVVNKITGTQKHSYKVSYKENNVGMCLTYIDASVSETVSYDKTGDNWVYNSTDVTLLGGTEVIANPTLAGTEADLTGLQVGENKYKVPEVINVVANPTLAGTETDLTSLQVGDTKYAIPQGSGGGATLYQHNIALVKSAFLDHGYAQLVIFNDSSTPLTSNDVYNYLNNKGFIVTTFGRITEEDSDTMVGKVYTLGTSACYSSNTIYNCAFIYNSQLCFGQLEAIGVISKYSSVGTVTVTDTVVPILQ